MDKSFLDMFARFSTKHENLKLTKETISAFEKNVKKYLDEGDSDSSDGSSAQIPSISVIAGGIAAQILAVLHKMHKTCKNDSQKRKLSNLIASLKESLDKAEETKQPVFVNEPQSVNSFQIPQTTPEQLELIENKLSQYSTFAINKSINKDYFPTNNNLVDTSSFIGLSRQELVAMFDAENFYKLNKNQVLSLLQATANEFLGSLGVSSCAILSKDLKFTDTSITFGEYDPNLGAISINSNILNLLESAKNTKDQFFPYQLLSTLIHEAKHRDQFNKLNKPATTQKDALINNALMHPHGSTYQEYLSSAEELDARNASLEYIREMALLTGSEALQQFYNIKKQEEDDKPKSPIPASSQAHFADIYSNERFNVFCDKVSKQKFRKIIKDSINDERNL